MSRNLWTRTRWSAFAVGAAIGMLNWSAFATMDRGIGVTSPFEQAAALLLRALGLGGGAPGPGPTIGWEWTLLLGLFLGAWLSARLSGDRSREAVPSMWAARFGDRPGPRLAVAFVGGVLVMLGARLAGGCTSGHGLTGAMQLAVASWVFLVGIFGSGAAVAWALYGRKGGRDV